MPPHRFDAARGSRREFRERGINGLVFSLEQGAERVGKMVAKSVR